MLPRPDRGTGPDPHDGFIAMGSTGTEGVLQQIAISAAAGISSIQQVTRLSVLNASADSLLITRVDDPGR